MLPSSPMSSMSSVSEQATAATMSKPINQHPTEARCCQCCTDDVERQHHKSRGSRLRTPIALTAFALFVLIGLLIVSCVQWNGHFSGMEFDELLPRDATGAIIGAIVSAAFSLLGITFIILFCARRTKRAKEEKEKAEKEKEEKKKKLAASERRRFKSLIGAPSWIPTAAPITAPASLYIPGWPYSPRPYTYPQSYAGMSGMGY